ncbi:ATP-dependent RNA helicase SUPV3L1, mitochondrial [Nymphon striatum]|nr:ATP-dependent RNA helicase SUPV3L1, mitochondrial [Nymphon striatum]
MLGESYFSHRSQELAYLAGNLLKLLLQFNKRLEIKQLSAENGLDASLFNQAFISFRKFCIESTNLPIDLHIIFSDIIQGAGHVDDLFPFFLQHARKVFPHLEVYREARSINRKIIFHGGPTNSGKTHHAIQSFFSAKSAIYCGPLKLLAVEVCERTNAMGRPCDLLTGESRNFVNPDNSPSSHISCTVEMAPLDEEYDVAVIDEIQMIKDFDRGYAWTRALLGLCAKEIHVCGELAAIKIVEDILLSTGEELQIQKYKRLTPLNKDKKALEKLHNIKPGDCIVCFSKRDIYDVSHYLETIDVECAVIYGSLPPTTKLAQAKRFNDENDSCKVLVATDAIGMGINLSQRINENGDLELDLISTSQALQIAGRAGRFGTSFSNGFYTTFKQADLPVLEDIMKQPVPEISIAGLHPTFDQIELFAYNLPQTKLSNIMDIFMKICQVDECSFFMCQVETIKFLATVIEHIPLDLKVRYVFCLSPVNKRATFTCAMFVKFARRFSRGEPISFDWLSTNIGCPFKSPDTIVELSHLEEVFDVCDIYLWLSYRFHEMFPDSELVKEMQQELDKMIQFGIKNISQLLKKSDGSNLLDASETIHSKKQIKWKIFADNDTDNKLEKITQLGAENVTQLLKKGNDSNLLDAAETIYPKKQLIWKNFADDTDDTDVKTILLPEVNDYTPSSLTIKNSNMDILATLAKEKFIMVGEVHGEYTKSLLDDGTLTPHMLNKLYKEWQESSKESSHSMENLKE